MDAIDRPHAAIAAPPRPYARPVVWGVIALAGLVMGLWWLGTPGSVWGKADAVGYAVCHRIPDRSFHVHGRALPLCARCTGIYLGVMTALAAYAGSGRLRSGRLPKIRLLAALALSGVAVAADGLNSYFSLFPIYDPVYMPHNTLRLVTGMFAGITLITVVLPVFNASVWRAPPPAAPLRSFKELAGLVLLAAPVIAAVLLELPALMVIFALVSTAGVVLMFSIVGGVLFLTVTRRENRAARWRDLALPAFAGLAFAISVIGVIDLIRYLLTGTWEGFTFAG